MEKRLLNERILELLTKSSSPLTIESIADYFHISQHETSVALDELVVGDIAIEYVPENKSNGRKYYTLASKKIEYTKDDESEKSENTVTQKAVKDAERAVVQETINVRDDYKDLSEKVELIDSNVNGIYANIISIMSIFVGIFALITVNANIAFTLTQENMSDVFTGIIAINVFVVICIIVLLLGIKLILINPMISKKKNG